MKELPKYKITIDEEYANGEDLGIDMIAFTSKPAIKVKGMFFTNNEFCISQQKFSDDLKMRIAAPALVPMDIFRDDRKEGGEEYYVEFTAEEIEKIYHKFMSTIQNKDLFNIEHNVENNVPAYVLEAMLADTKNKIKFIKDEYGIDVVLGTMFLVSQITDKEYFNKLVENDQTGFSIEGFLGIKLSEIKQIKTKTKMEEIKLPNGEWTIDGKIYVVKDGAILEIKEIGAADAPVADATVADATVADATVADATVADAAVADAADTAYVADATVADAPVADAPVASGELTMEVVQGMIDAKVEELTSIIADLQVKIDSLIPKEEVSTESVRTGPAGGITIHNDLSGLQGGTTSQYYHLTESQFINNSLKTDPLISTSSVVSGTLTTTSTTDTLMTSLEFTGILTGLYFANFGTSLSHGSTNETIFISIYVNGTKVAGSERIWQRGGSQGNIIGGVDLAGFPMTITTTSTVEIRWRTSTGTATSTNRHFTLLRVDRLSV